MKKLFLTLTFLIISQTAFAADELVNAIPEKAKSGGALTVADQSRNAFGKSDPNLTPDELRKFAFGNRIFTTNWVTAPASVKSLDGLGPVFNRNSCAGCHFKDGRGRPPHNSKEEMTSMLVRLSIPGEDENGGPNPHPAYGGQFNPHGINGVKGEGKVKISYQEIVGSFGDGSNYKLRKPTYTFTQLNYGKMGDDLMISPRVAPVVFGLGLLEAIPEATILANADPEDKNKDGISGRANYAYNVTTKKKELGRFGWKANQPTLDQQDSGAALGDIGITTSIFPEQNCTDAQKECKKAPTGGDPEMTDFQRERLDFYMHTIAVPARRDIENEDALHGEKLFAQIGCSGCHTPKVKTGKHPIKNLENQEIMPYTDMLLHDMGEGLADNRPDFLATGKEWRTPPLWGIGLVKIVNQHTNFLHDGRARNLEEAILWHGGEAQKAQENYKNLPKKDRRSLIEFLESL